MHIVRRFRPPEDCEVVSFGAAALASVRVGRACSMRYDFSLCHIGMMNARGNGRRGFTLSLARCVSSSSAARHSPERAPLALVLRFHDFIGRIKIVCNRRTI